MTSTTAPYAVPVAPTQPQRRLRAVLKRGLLGLLATLAGMSSIGAIYEYLAERADVRAYPPPGQMVTVDGRRLHLLVTGSDTGQPTVLLEAGIATFSANWAWVQEGLASSTRVVAYDRAGLGWSDPAPEPHDAYQSARDLHAALQAAGIPGPYVVAGHSYGGLVVRAFTDLFPAEVAGMVLVDASHPDQWAHIPASRGGRMVEFGNRVTSLLARVGIVRLFRMTGSVIAGLPERPAAELRAILAWPRSWTTSGDSLSLWESRSRRQVNQAHSLGALPLFVLSVSEQPAYAEVLTALQADLTGLSSNSQHRTVTGATHEGLIARPEHARVVVDAIQRVIQAAQTGQPLK